MTDTPMRSLLSGAALLVLATAGASAQALEDRRPIPPSEDLDRPLSPHDRVRPAPDDDDDDDDDMGAPLRRGGPPSMDDDDRDTPSPPPKSDRL
jgi:hypothetical protein